MESKKLSPISKSEQRIKLRKQVLFSLFVAIVVLLSFTPLGFIQLVFIKATSVHIPVILGGLLLGPSYGAALGAVFGLCSLINNSINPSLLSFCFSPLMPVPGTDQGSILSLLICFLPRVFTGFFPAFLMKKIKAWRLSQGQAFKAASEAVMAAILAALGALCNTIPVMSLIYLFFSDSLALLKGLSGDAVLSFVLGVISTNGIPESLVAAVFTALAYPVLININMKKM